MDSCGDPDSGPRGLDDMGGTAGCNKRGDLGAVEPCVDTVRGSQSANHNRAGLGHTVCPPLPPHRNRPDGHAPTGDQHGHAAGLASSRDLGHGRDGCTTSAVSPAVGSAEHETCWQYSEVELQPKTRPISLTQLVNEVKGIYVGLVMVETKCIEIDTRLGASENTPITDDQWQALVALHRTLLHEHHDFLLASHHPSASPALRRLAEKYAMPARMWRHGIHSFLELLRHRLPDAQEHMETFIYMAYSMIALLYETVPAYEDTWVECLGDLGRYRMAIEDLNQRERDTWTGVERDSYALASAFVPTTGRLYHHLAILARPLHSPPEAPYDAYRKGIGDRRLFGGDRTAAQRHALHCAPRFKRGLGGTCPHHAVLSAYLRMLDSFFWVYDNDKSVPYQTIAENSAAMPEYWDHMKPMLPPGRPPDSDARRPVLHSQDMKVERLLIW